jgi:hypothetical protein
MYKSKRYVQALKDYQIMPVRMNMFHFYTFLNMHDCIKASMKVNQRYITDIFKNTPLKYALERKSFQCVEELLKNSVK